MAKKGTKNPDSTEKQGKKAVMNYMQFINGNSQKEGKSAIEQLVWHKNFQTDQIKGWWDELVVTGIAPFTALVFSTLESSEK